MPDLFVARISRPAKYTLGTTRWEQMFPVPFLNIGLSPKIRIRSDDPSTQVRETLRLSGFI